MGNTSVRLYAQRIDDIVDTIPIGIDGESPGNIDQASLYGVEWKATFNLDPIGWRGAKLTTLVQRCRATRSAPPEGARDFAQGLYDYLHGRAGLERRFERWVAAIEGLPRRQTRVLTWPLVTVFGFIAQPDRHMFMKPNTIRAAAKIYGYDLPYQSRPTWDTYSRLLDFSECVARDLADLKPRDMIDLQSFLWVQGSDEY